MISSFQIITCTAFFDFTHFILVYLLFLLSSIHLLLPIFCEHHICQFDQFKWLVLCLKRSYLLVYVSILYQFQVCYQSCSCYAYYYLCFSLCQLVVT
jgi:hypothetical protein